MRRIGEAAERSISRGLESLIRTPPCISFEGLGRLLRKYTVQTGICDDLIQAGPLQVAVVAFKRGQLKVLSLQWDRDLGGKDFDEVLFDHFVEEFDAKYKLDIRSKKWASFIFKVAVD